jgi:hypothetical protein
LQINISLSGEWGEVSLRGEITQWAKELRRKAAKKILDAAERSPERDRSRNLRNDALLNEH